VHQVTISVGLSLWQRVHTRFATAQFVVGLGDKVAPTDIEEGMRVGCGITLRSLLSMRL
jgi:hypothetical protein